MYLCQTFARSHRKRRHLSRSGTGDCRGRTTPRMEEDSICIDHGLRIDAELMRLHVVPGQTGVAHVTRRDNYITVHLPAGTDLDATATQAWLRRAVTALVREEARRQLPARLARHAAAAGLAYRRVSIRNTRSRWGSCSSLGNINLSQWLMLLPAHLADYVILHELAHLEEMNHGPRFWQVLDRLTGGHARRLAAETRAYARTHSRLLRWCMAPADTRTQG